MPQKTSQSHEGVLKYTQGSHKHQTKEAKFWVFVDACNLGLARWSSLLARIMGVNGGDVTLEAIFTHFPCEDWLLVLFLCAP